jgi:DNA-binding transcriptional regulator GbsR (MarR family)
MARTEDVEKKIYSTFAEVAGSLGYSPLHGKIIGALLVNGQPMSLQELAKKTGYSVSMVSLSLDLLEVIGTIKKVKKEADRQLYISLQGDLLESLKNAILIRVKKSVTSSLTDFEESKRLLRELEGAEKERLLRTIQVLEKEIRRLEVYVNLLSGLKLP